MHILALIFCSFVVFFVKGNAQIVCPSKPIDVSQGLTGQLFNSNTNQMSLLPSNFSCFYTWTIPQEYALHLTISTNYNYQVDTIDFIDNLNMRIRLGTPINNIQQWAVKPNASLDLNIKTNTARLYVRYEFVNLGTYQQINLNTGDYRTLAFAAKRFYTFSSVRNDRVALNLAKKSTSFNFVAQHYFLFDGYDLINARMIGKLSQFDIRTIYSSYSAITVVNFYGTQDSSYLLANDKSTIDTYGSYNVVLVGSGLPFSSQIADSSPNGGLYTFICDSCTKLYLNQLAFNSSQILGGHVDIKPLSPTYRGPTLIQYGVTTTSSNMFPQLIPTRMFTMALNYSRVDVSIGVSNSNWQLAYDGRRGTVFPPKLWDPSYPNVYIHSFAPSNKTLQFSYGISFQKHNFVDAGALTFKVGNSNGIVNYNKTFSKTSASYGPTSFTGSFMTLSYNSNNSTDVIVNFQMSLKGAMGSASSLTSFIFIILLYIIV